MGVLAGDRVRWTGETRDGFDPVFEDARSGLLYSLQGEGVSIRGCRRHVEELEIPAEIEGLPVLSVGESAFRDDRRLRALVLPEGLREVGVFSFRRCRNLESVHFPSGLEALGTACFESDSQLRTVDLPDSLASIASSAFRNCRSLECVGFPSSLALVGTGAFSGCGSLAAVDLPDGVEEIRPWAFSCCKSLSGLDLPPSTKVLGMGAFFGCSGLTRMGLDEGLESIGERCFCGCGSLRGIRLPQGVGSVGDGAFSDCPGLRMLVLPDRVRVFGKWLGRTPAGSLLFASGVPIGAMEPHSYRLAAAAGFVELARKGRRFPPPLFDEYLAFLRGDVCAVCEYSGFDTDSIWWLVEQGVVGTPELRALIELSASQGRTETTAVLLEYAERIDGFAEERLQGLEL